jgi:hypothetical protein
VRFGGIVPARINAAEIVKFDIECGGAEQITCMFREVKGADRRLAEIVWDRCATNINSNQEKLGIALTNSM